jgi:hypothetical protein
MVLASTLTYSSLGIAVAVFFFIFGILAAYILYQKKQQRKYSFLNEFPYELYQGIDQKYISIFYIIQMVQALGFIVFGFYSFTDNKNYYGIILLTSWTLTALLMAALSFVKLRSMRGHITIVAFLFTLTLVNAIFLGIYFYKTIYLDVPLAFPIISFVLAAVVLGLMINPLLKRWPYMDKIEQQDGQIIILRPKFFVLAYTEWLLILINYLLMLLAFIGNFFV